MGVKVAATCLQWSQPIIRHSPSSSQALASAISSPSSSKRRCRRSDSSAGTLRCRYSVQRLDGWGPLFGSSSPKLTRSPSCEYPETRRAHTMKRACSASLNSFDDEDFSKKMVEMSIRFQQSGDDQDADADANTKSTNSDCVDSRFGDGEDSFSFSPNQTEFFLRDDTFEPPWDNIREAALDWSYQIERKANSVEIPLSLRIIQKKLMWEDGFREAGETACCSVRKAFSSMWFIIRELHCYSLQMRELLFTEDLQGILARVQKEMHASFVWLFQQVFSQTPTLMVYVMILLANFTVHSMSANVAIASYPQPASTVEIVSVVEVEDQMDQTFDSSTVKSFSVSSSSSGKSTSVGGNIGGGGGGGNFRLVGNGTEGDGQSDGLDQFRTIVPDGASQMSSVGAATGDAESVSGEEVNRVEDELGLWNSIVEEAAQMQASLRDESLDHETMQSFVSPITAIFEPDDYSDYFRTELQYKTSLSQEPTNALLLANFAQFLYLVAHDYDRAEEYFKKAVGVVPPDAEAYSKYATFLWKVKNDLWAAEETYLEAISADPRNSYHAANYAHFLWNTGGEDTCYPLGTDNNAHSNNNNNIQEM